MGRPKKEVVPSTTATPIKEVVKKPSAKETELESQVKQLQEMMLEMKKMMTAPKVDALPAVGNYGELVAPIGEESVDVPFRQYIKVMSLTNHRLTLSTEGFGNGTVFNFINYGQVQSILYEDLAKIIHNNERFAKEGYFFIMDSRVIKIHNLENEYSKILDKNKIDNILNMDVDSVRTLLRNTTPHIKNTIASMVIEKLTNSEDIDLNKVRVISTESGKDIDAIVKSLSNFNQPSE